MATRAWRRFRVNEDNIPQPLPGVYRFTNLMNGKPYIGIGVDLRRRCGSHGEKGSPPKLAGAIARYGRRNFLCEPLFYWTSGESVDRKFLCEVEAGLITAHDAVRSGYNVQERSDEGPFGPEWVVLMTEVARRRSKNLSWKTSHRAGLERWRQSDEGRIAIRAGVEKRRSNLSLGSTLTAAWVERRERQRLSPKPPSPRHKEARARLATDPAWIAAHEAARPRMSAGARKAGLARTANLPPERIAEIGRMGGLAGGRAGAQAQRARMTDEEVRQMASNGGKRATEHKDPDGKSAHARRMGRASVASTTSEYRHERALRAGAAADHGSPQARENHRRAALLREAARRGLRQAAIAMVLGV